MTAQPMGAGSMLGLIFLCFFFPPLILVLVIVALGKYIGGSRT